MLPQMEFGASVWQNSSSSDKIQRKGIALNLGAPALTNAVEAKARILPLELR